jgi:hypothetical protein
MSSVYDDRHPDRPFRLGPRDPQGETGRPAGALRTECDTGAGDRATGPYGGVAMADVLYIGMTAVFFWLSWLLVKLCERL